MIGELNAATSGGVSSFVTMRTTPSVLAAVLVLGATSAAFAQERVAGTYDVKFEEMASNCTPPPVTLTRGKLTIEIHKHSLTVNTDLIPIMVGVPEKHGQINAKTRKVVGTTVQGLAGKYHVAGRVENGMISLVLVAEYINEATRKPYCTQSWNLSGLKQDGAKK
jgi:hypothetical protein